MTELDNSLSEPALVAPYSFDSAFIPISPRLKENVQWLPKRYSEKAVAWDVRYVAEQEGKFLIIPPGESAFINCGFSLQLHDYFAALLLIRSGTSKKSTLLLTNSVGVIEPDYKEAVCANLFNYGKAPIMIVDKERVLQITFSLSPYGLTCLYPAQFELSPCTQTRQGGFGSSGVS